MRYHYTTSNCLKPQSLFRSALSPSRASSPAARFQWTDVDTPERYPAIHFKNGHVTCYVMLGHIRLYYNHEAMSNAVKRCQTLSNASDSKLLAPGKVFCFQMFSDKLINSPQNIDPVLRPREARNRPSHLEKKNSDFEMETVPSWSMDWLRWENLNRKQWITHDFTMKHRGLLQIFPSDRSWWTSWPKTSRKVVGITVGYAETTWVSEVSWTKWECNIKNHQQSWSCRNYARKCRNNISMA